VYPRSTFCGKVHLESLRQVGFGQPILCHKWSDSASLAFYSIVKVRNLGLAQA
jgi:hypothetical protein